MNTKTLVQSYHNLTALERTSLMVAAYARDDEAEIQRLLDSAPRLCFRIVHCFGAGQGLLAVNNLAIAGQLASLVSFWQSHAMVADEPPDDETNDYTNRL